MAESCKGAFRIWADVAALIGKEQLVNKARELQSQTIEKIVLRFVDMALTTEISEKEA